MHIYRDWSHILVLANEDTRSINVYTIAKDTVAHAQIYAVNTENLKVYCICAREKTCAGVLRLYICDLIVATTAFLLQ